MLILKALSVVAESVGDDCYHEIEKQYLHNKYCAEEFKVKLKPIKSDNNQFLLLLEDKIDQMGEDPHTIVRIGNDDVQCRLADISTTSNPRSA